MEKLPADSDEVARAFRDDVARYSNTPAIIYCFKGARASNTFVALEEAGIRNVSIYFGSWNEWSRDPSLPIEEGLPYPVSRLAAGR